MTRSHRQGRAKRGNLGIAFVALAVSGCAGTLDPIVGPTREAPVNPSIDTALEYANDLKSQYKLAIQNQARLTTWVGVGLIPLAAAAGGVGVLLAHTHITLGILGLTGATAFGTASYLRNQPAQLAYLGGHEALNCTVRVVAPLRIASSAEPTGQDFRKALERIGDDIAEARAQIARVEFEIARVRSSTPEVVFARSEVQTAQRNVIEAEKTHAAGIKLQAALSAMPGLIADLLGIPEPEELAAIFESDLP